MFLKYINSNRNSVIILFLLLPVIYWIPSLFQASANQLTTLTGVPFGRWIVEFNIRFPVFASLLALLLIIVNGNLLNQLNTVHIFIPFRSQLPLFFYTVLTLSITQLHQLTPALVASFVIIFVFFRIFKAYKFDRDSINFLDAGLLIALASLIYFPASAFLVFLLAGLLLLRPFIWREYAFSIIGFVIPYFFVISFYYLVDIPIREFFSDISQSFSRTPSNFRLSQIISWSVLLLFVLIASYYLATAIDSMKIHARKFFLVFLAFFICSVLIFLIIDNAGAGIVYFAAIPLSYVFSYYFVKCRRNYLNEALIILFLMLWIYQRIM
jgi:hypothetical protein